MLLHVFAHVDACHHVLVVEEVFGQGLGKLGLADASGAEEDERTDGAAGVVETGAGAAHGIAHGLDGVVLAHDAAVEFLLQVEQLLLLALGHFLDRDAGPVRDNLGDVFGVDFLLDHGAVALKLVQTFLDFLVLVLLLLDEGVADFGHTCVVAFALGLLGLEVQLLDVLLVLLYLLDLGLLGHPLGAEALLGLAQVGELLVNLLELVLVSLALDSLTFDFELHDGSCGLVECLRHGVALQAQLRGGLVDEVDGLVGQEAVGDIAHRELHGGDDGLVFDADAVVILVALLEAAQNGDGGHLVGFVDHDLLKATFQGLVLLEVLLVLVESGGADGAKLAAGQGRLEDVGGVHGALALSGAHQGVDLVDEEDNLAVGGGDLLDNGLEALLELALILGTGHQGAHVETVDLL